MINKCSKLCCVLLVLIAIGCAKEEPGPSEQSAADVEKKTETIPVQVENAEEIEVAKQAEPNEPAEKTPVKIVEKPVEKTAPTRPAEPVKTVEAPEPVVSEDPLKDLRLAVVKGDLDQVSKAIAAGADVNAKDREDFTVLHLALIQGNEELAALLIANGADTKAKMTNGIMPLHFAAMKGCRLMAEFLIDDGSDVNAQDQTQGTPLHYAVYFSGDVEIVKLLIAKGADINAKNPRGQTAFEVARQKGQTELLDLLKLDGTQEE